MKNILRLSLLSAGFVIISSAATAQDIKKDAANTADQLEAPKPADSKTGPVTDSKTDKQEPVKTTPASGAAGTSSSKTEKADSAQTGGTRMAISEQGIPKKNKKGKSSKTAPAATAAEPPKK